MTDYCPYCGSDKVHEVLLVSEFFPLRIDDRYNKCQCGATWQWED